MKLLLSPQVRLLLPNLHPNYRTKVERAKSSLRMIQLWISYQAEYGKANNCHQNLLLLLVRRNIVLLNKENKTKSLLREGLRPITDVQKSQNLLLLSLTSGHLIKYPSVRTTIVGFLESTLYLRG